MRQITLALLALLLLWSTALTAVAQDKKPAEEKPAAPQPATDGDQPKNQVDEMIAEVRKRGETVLGVCLQNCAEEQDKDTPDSFERPQPLSLPTPAYPGIARAARAAGEVWVRVLVDHEGKVIAASAVSGHPLLQASCVQAARESVFTPPKLDGKPIMVSGLLLYKFTQRK